MKFGYWLRNPLRLVPRLRYWVWERLNPDKPWMCPGTIAFCEAHLRPEMRGLEFGSGRSTQWFAQRLAALTSVECYEPWYQEVRRRLTAAHVQNVDLRFVGLDHPYEAPERLDYDPTPAYVAVLETFPDQSLDLVIVDGHYRTNCIRRAIRKIAPGGFLLLDDAQRYADYTDLQIPATWRVADNSSNGVKRCLIWQAA